MNSTDQSVHHISPAGKRRVPPFLQVAQIVFLLLIMGGTLFFLRFADDRSEMFHSVVTFLAERPRSAYLLFFVLYVLSCVLLLPGFLLTASAGVLFGLPGGIAITSLSVVSGAAMAFFLGRKMLRESVQEWLADHPQMLALDRAVAEEGWKFVLLARLCPFVPFRMSNYLFSLTGIRFVPFILATWIGTLPSAAVIVSIGAGAGSMAALQGRRDFTLIEWLGLGLGVIILVALLKYFRKVMKRAQGSVAAGSVS